MRDNRKANGDWTRQREQTVNAANRLQARHPIGTQSNGKAKPETTGDKIVNIRMRSGVCEVNGEMVKMGLSPVKSQCRQRLPDHAR